MTLDEILKDKPEILKEVKDAIKEAGSEFVDISEGKYIEIDKYNDITKKYDDLSKAENPFETKYNELLVSSKNDMTNERKRTNDIIRNMAVDRALDRLNIRDELTKKGIRTVIKMSDIKIDDNYNISGLDEQIETIKETYKDSFEEPVVVDIGRDIRGSNKEGTRTKVYTSIAEIKSLSVEDVKRDYDNIMSQLSNLK